jgi:transcription antitermination factor NusG
MDVKWYAVLTAPNSEAKASAYLKRQGYHTFYPHVREKRYAGRRRSMLEVERPFFSRYLFVCFTKPTHNHFDVNETFGVSTTVSVANEPLQIPNAVIDDLMRMADEDGLIRRQEPPHWFQGKVGDTVTLKDEAPFYGLVAEIASVAALDRKDAISVWIDLLGARREVEVGIGAIADVRKMAANGSRS